MSIFLTETERKIRFLYSSHATNTHTSITSSEKSWCLQVTSSDVLFCATLSWKLKDVQFAVIENRENQQIIIFVRQKKIFIY